MTTDCELLLDAIELFPDNDQPRLEYADALDYDGYSPRAELIRVQIELATMGSRPECSDGSHYIDCPGCIWKNRRKPLYARETELLREYESEFRRGPKCEKCTTCTPSAHYPKSSYRECHACQNTKDVGGLMRLSIPQPDIHFSSDGLKPWLHTVEFVRGFPRVHCRMEECVKWKTDHDNGYDAGNHVPTAWLLSVVRHHRGVEVWVTDREPEPWAMQQSDPTRYVWYCGTLRTKQTVPEVLFDALAGWDDIGDGRKIYNTREKGMMALARAIPAWARGHIKPA